MSQYFADQSGMIDVKLLEKHLLIKLQTNNYRWSFLSGNGYKNYTFNQLVDINGAAISVPLCTDSYYFPYSYRINEKGEIEKNIPSGTIEGSHSYLLIKDHKIVKIVYDLKGFMDEANVGVSIHSSINPDIIDDNQNVLMLFEESAKHYFYYGPIKLLRESNIQLKKGVVLCYGQNSGIAVKTHNNTLRTYGETNRTTNIIITLSPASVCDLPHNCDQFDDASDDMFYLVNNFFRDLKSYANYVVPKSSTININFKLETNKLKEINYIENGVKIPAHKLDMLTTPNLLYNTVQKIKRNLKNVTLTPQQYMNNVKSYEIFTTGDASPTILIRMERLIDNKLVESIAKIAPLQLKNQKKYMTELEYRTYVEAPLNAIFLKEAWLYCFSQIILSKYVPTFACIKGSYIVNSLPLGSVDNIKKLLIDYESEKKGKISDKSWFSYLVDRFELPGTTKNEVINSEYGIFEMEKVSGVFRDLIIRKELSIPLFFEYLISKVVAAKVGKILFADDHSGNVAYKKLDNVTTRCYRITQNNIVRDFYVHSDKMIKFIDLERYVFNIAKEEYYALSPMTDELSKLTVVERENKVSVEHLSTDKYLIDKMFSNIRKGKYFIGKEEDAIQDFLRDPRLGIIDKILEHVYQHLHSFLSPPSIIDKSFYHIYDINLDTMGCYWENVEK